MKRTPLHLFAFSLLAALSLSASTCAHASALWTDPTPEELKMTSQPQVPGAAAVYLYREETTEDKLHMFSIYVRLKVLTERGKEYANVEIPFSTGESGMSIDNIAGRTIHADGSVVPFTSKPYDKLIVKSQGSKVMSKVFSMPDVEVGSIIEYRYKLRNGDRYFIAPEWFIQSNLFTRKAHYEWKPTSQNLVTNDDRGQMTNGIAWTPILPPNATLKQTQAPAVTGRDGQSSIDLDVTDVPPTPEEEYMPPIASLSYRVLFYYTPYRTGAEYWKSEGKHWAKVQDKFIGPNSGVAAAVQQLTSPADGQQAKLRKLYAAVMELENSDFTRTHSTDEEKSEGLSKIHTTDDILSRKRGSGDQLAQLFVAMARAAGMKAYVMAVTNRDHHLFLSSFLSLRQLDDYIAIVNVEGKEQFFDPGARFCPFQHLSWLHTYAGGIRQIDGGSALATTPSEPYTFSQILRTANLTLDSQGIVTGSVKLVYKGSPAIDWRQRSLKGDAANIERELRLHLERMLPQGMEVKVSSVDKLADYEAPLVVNYQVKGPIASSAGKRILLPGDVFEMNSKPAFPHEKREIPVYFEYSSTTQDAVRISFPPGFSVESLPASSKYQFLSSAAYALKTESAPTSVTFRREFAMGDIIFKPDQYAALRSFYSQFETKDQEPVVLTLAAAKPDIAGN